MIDDFIIECNDKKHQGQSVGLKIFKIFTKDQRINVWDISMLSGTETHGRMLLNDKPILEEIRLANYKRFEEQGRIRVRYSFNCDCGNPPVEVRSERLIPIVKDLYRHGVLRLSLVELQHSL